VCCSPAGSLPAGVVIAGIAALLVASAEAAQVPAADYLAHMVGLQQLLGGFATSDIAALVMFALLGGVLYRVARR
jgi:hypothetical protein